MAVGSFRLPISAGSSPSTGWTPPADWIDISTVADNEINLLVTEGTGIGFVVKVGTGAGTHSIDWGDGTIETGLIGNGTTVRQHQHTTGGTPCSLGYNTWKVRIYGASENITIWKVSGHSFTTNNQYHPILSANFGTRYITDYSNTFYSSAPNVFCRVLEKCVICDLSNCTSTSYMFNSCFGLISLTLPSSWGLVNNVSSMLNSCYGLTSLTLPSSWGLVNDLSNMLNSCFGLISLTLPSSWGLVNNVSGLCSGCYGLISLTLPSSWGSISNVSNMLVSCYSLKIILNINYLGSIITPSNFTSALQSCEFLQQNIVINSLLSAIGIYGASGKLLKCTSIRLTNAGSTFSGTSPQVNVSYTSLAAADIDLLFGDLPALVGKTINITGCPGAATCTRSIVTGKGWTVTG